MWPVNSHKTENLIWHWYLENGKHFQVGSRGVALRIVGSKKISQPIVFWLHEDETQADPQGSVGHGKRWEMCEWTRSSGHAGHIEQVTFHRKSTKIASSMWEGVSLVYPCTLSSFMAPTGSKSCLYLTVGVQHPSFLLFHVNEESKGGIIIYGRCMEHLTVLINIPNYFIFGTKHTFCLLIRSFIITIFLFWTALLLWIIWGGVIFFFVLYV